MHIIVWGDEGSNEEFKAKKMNPDTQVIYVKNLSELSNYSSANAFFILKDGINKEDYKAFGRKPVFINSAIHTLKELNLPENFCRINGWPTFLNREIWEIATAEESSFRDIFKKLQWNYITVADEPGLVSARIISMIINESYFALGEDISSKNEIDLAMKLGTNYPYGPFEWSKKIGLQKVYDLLEKLNKTDSRYEIAPAMKNELTNS